MVTPLLTPTLESGRNARDYCTNYPTLSHRALLHTNNEPFWRGFGMVDSGRCNASTSAIAVRLPHPRPLSGSSRGTVASGALGAEVEAPKVGRQQSGRQVVANG